MPVVMPRGRISEGGTTLHPHDLIDSRPTAGPATPSALVASPIIAPVRSIRTGLVAVLTGADGALRQVLAIVCAGTAVASASAIVEIVATNYLA